MGSTQLSQIWIWGSVHGDVLNSRLFGCPVLNPNLSGDFLSCRRRDEEFTWTLINSYLVSTAFQEPHLQGGEESKLHGHHPGEIEEQAEINPSQQNKGTAASRARGGAGEGFVVFPALI